MTAPARLLGRRDLRPYIYLALDQILVVVYSCVLAFAIPNRHASAMLHLWALPICMQLMALGCAAKLLPNASHWRLGWRTAVTAGTLMLGLTILLIVRVVVSAAFLAGVYGAFGKAAAMFAIVGIALIVEVFALVPLFQVKYLMSRAGRRTFAMPT
jgi:hypothetical protein